MEGNNDLSQSRASRALQKRCFNVVMNDRYLGYFLKSANNRDIESLTIRLILYNPCPRGTKKHFDIIQSVAFKVLYLQ